MYETSYDNPDLDLHSSHPGSRGSNKRICESNLVGDHKKTEAQSLDLQIKNKMFKRYGRKRKESERKMEGKKVFWFLV